MPTYQLIVTQRSAMRADYDAHTLSLTDIPRVLRLAENGIVLNARIGCTTAASGPNGALLESMLPRTSRHTLVARYGERIVVGQFYIADDEKNAHIVYLAPRIVEGEDDSAWLVVLDAMVREAGRRGAHTLKAELSEDSPLFITLRQSGFAVYARQQLWVHRPQDGTLQSDSDVTVVPATESDQTNIAGIYARTVPSLLQHVGAVPDLNGYLFYDNGLLLGYIHVTAGRDGLYVMPYLDYNLSADRAAQVIVAAAVQIPRINKRLLTVCIQRHQGWLGNSLYKMGFLQGAKQAVMVKHIAAGVHSPEFAPLKTKLAAGNVPHKTERIPEVRIDVHTTHTQTISNMIWTAIDNRDDCDGLPHIHPLRYALRPNGGLTE